VSIGWFELAFVSAFFSAAAAILQKKVLSRLQPLTFSLAVSIPVLISTLVFLPQLQLQAVSLQTLLTFSFKTVLSTLFFLSVMYSLKNNEISSALPLLALTPGLVAVTAFIFLGEALTSNEIIGLLCMLAGPFILEADTLHSITAPFKSLLTTRSRRFILVALALSVVSTVLDKYFLKTKLTPPNLLVIQHVLMVGLYIILFAGASALKKIDWRHELQQLSSRTVISLVSIIGVITLVYRAAQIYATKMAASVALVLAVKRLSVVFAVILGGRLLKEPSLFRKSIAALIIAVGTLLITRYA